MSIKVRKTLMPTIVLTGSVIEDSGLIAGPHIYEITPAKNKIIISSNGKIITKRDTVLVFYGEVKMEIVPPYSTYPFRQNADYEEENEIGRLCKIYYTVNGKDPTRTKKYLWKNRNLYFHYDTSGDSVVLKARTYYQGKISDVLTVEFQIKRANKML